MWALPERACDGIFSLLPGYEWKERYLPSWEKAWNQLHSADNLLGCFECFGGSKLPMHVPEAPEMSLQIWHYWLSEALHIFLFEAHCCQDGLDPSLGITLPPALPHLCAIYPDPETQWALSVGCRGRGNIAVEVTAPDIQLEEWEICHHTFC